jgi:uncharacterized protein HemY
MDLRMSEGRRAWLWRAGCVGVLDALALFCANFVVLWLRFDFQLNNVPVVYINHSLQLMPLNIIILIVLYFVFRLYHSICDMPE